MKNMEKNQNLFSPRLVSMEMAAIFDYRAYNFKKASSNVVKSCTRIEDIYMKKPSRVFF